MKKILAISAVALSLAACNTPGERAAGGALIGGAAGAGIGAAVGGGRGAVVGGLLGAGTGAIVGAGTAQPNCREYIYRGRRYQECY